MGICTDGIFPFLALKINKNDENDGSPIDDDDDDDEDHIQRQHRS